MAKYTATANYNDPWHHDLRFRGDVVEYSDDKPDDDDVVGKAQARQVKDLVRRGLIIEGEHSKEDLDKRDEKAAAKAQADDKSGDGSEPQTDENVEADPNSPKPPADRLLAPGVAAKDVPGGEEKLEAATKAGSKAKA